MWGTAWSRGGLTEGTDSFIYLKKSELWLSSKCRLLWVAFTNSDNSFYQTRLVLVPNMELMWVSGNWVHHTIWTGRWTRHNQHCMVCVRCKDVDTATSDTRTHTTTRTHTRTHIQTPNHLQLSTTPRNVATKMQYMAVDHLPNFRCSIQIPIYLQRNHNRYTIGCDYVDYRTGVICLLPH